MEANTEVYHVPNNADDRGATADHRRNVNTLYANGRMVAPRQELMAQNAESTRDVRARAGSPQLVKLPAPFSPMAFSPTRYVTSSCSTLIVLAKWHQQVPAGVLDHRTGLGRWGRRITGQSTTVSGSAISCSRTRIRPQIQRSMESPSFKGVPLSYQEARIYHWNQNADQQIGADQIPAELRVQPVISKDWVYPNDPRLKAIGQ